MKHKKCVSLFLFSAATLLFSMMLSQGIQAQSRPDPKREFRGVWIATVDNIDWPSSKRLSTEMQQQECIRMLDNLKNNGINCVIVQVRCAADAFYTKSIEPWSEWLTGTQGGAPSPLYDPLDFFIQEAHKRSMEIHAWINPYRAELDVRHSKITSNSIIKKNPGWFFRYGKTRLFNPGIPGVRAYILGIVMNLVRNYDIDGLHLDDYFYPYPVKDADIPDDDVYEQFGEGAPIEDWRRKNVNMLIQAIHDSMSVAKPYVKFGVSPFGIWRNNTEDPEGSNTHGLSSYSGLYADSRLWVKNGWCDYINPQDYFSVGYGTAAYEELVRWWARNAYGRSLVVGIAAYKFGSSGDWNSLNQLGQQMRISRSYPEVQGQDFFNARTLLANKLGIADTLRQHYYRYPALMPKMNSRDTVLPLPPTKLVSQVAPDGIHLSWQAGAAAKDGELARYYVVYRFENQEPVNLNNPKNIRKIIFRDTGFIDRTFTNDRNYFYVVTSLDRVQNESLGTCNVYVTFKKEIRR